MANDAPAVQTVAPAASEPGPDAGRDGNAGRPARRWSALKAQWNKRLDPGGQAVVLSWTAFTATFAGSGC